MKGVAGRQSRGVQTGTVLNVIDNTGAKTIAIITVPGYHGTSRRYPKAGVGDIVIASVKKGSPEMRRQVVYAIIVRQRRPFRRADGVMTALSVILRHFFTDYVGQAESQKIVSAFNKELQKARVENNKYKIKKLTEEQPKILQKSMDMSTSQMKLMPVTMLAIIPIFAWLSVWMGQLDPAAAVVNVPWASNVSLTATNVFPNWVLLYSLISIPFGQILSRALRYMEFRKKLRQIGAQAA